MKRYTLLLGLGFMLWNGPAQADLTFKQTRVNVSMAVPSFDHAANDLREVSEAFDAQLENLNMDANSGSGNATFKVPQGQVAEVMAKLAKVGRLENQSQSTSDYTSSVAQYDRKTKAYRAMAELDAKALFSRLPAEQRADVITEFQTFVSNGLQSNESQAASYRDMAKVVEVSVSLTTKSSAPAPIAVATPTDSDSSVATVPVASAPDSRPVYLLCLLNFLGLWAIYRRVDRAEPPEPSRHTH